MAYDSQNGVNVAECLALADFLEALPPEKFDMRSYNSHECDTPACIGGWIARLNGMPVGESTPVFAAEVLQITSSQAACLFAPPPDDHGWVYRATRKQAARVLRHLAATGEVDWSVALGGAR